MQSFALTASCPHIAPRVMHLTGIGTSIHVLLRSAGMTSKRESTRVRRTDAIADFAATIWKKCGGRLQWRLLWLTQAKFMIGVTGAVFDDAGRVLLLKHRYWTGSPWGLPSGYAHRGESVEDALVREIREETGSTADRVQVAWIRSGYRLRLEVYCTARCLDSRSPHVASSEIEDARFVDVSDLPDRLRPNHKDLIAWAIRNQAKS